MKIKKSFGSFCLLTAMVMSVGGGSAAEKIDTDPKHQFPKPDGKPPDMTKLV